MVWRRTIAVALFALLAAGCGGGGGEEGQESLRVTKTEGPIFGMAVADSVDHEGKLVAPSSTFAADVPRLTVVVHMGKVTGSLLTVTWYQERRKLFEHTLEVGSFDSAYSTGKNPGTLAPGRYRAEATLEGTTQAVEWDVAQGSGTTAAVSDVPQGSPPAAGGTGVIDSPGTRGGDISNLDPGDGGSGSGPDCELRLFTGYFDNLDRDADLADIIAEADCDGIVDVAAAALGVRFATLERSAPTATQELLSQSIRARCRGAPISRIRPSAGGQRPG